MNNPTFPDVAASHVTVRDGTRIGYSLYGDPRNPVRVALVHSLAMDRHFWTPVVERLLPRAAVLAIDARGHGLSGKPAGPYTVPLFAQDLRDVIAALGFEGALIAGASMGGCVALQFAATYPDAAIAAGLIDTTAWYGETAASDWNARAEKAESGGLPPLVDFQATRWFSDAFRAAHPEVVQQCVDTFLRNEVAAFAATGRMLGAFDGRALMRDVRMPACVIVGEEDYAATPAMARALNEGIADSTLVEIPKARHLTPLETPDVVARELHALLDRAGCPR
jgi:pimeloyl-ACP methyl ester carboxylesterase